MRTPGKIIKHYGIGTSGNRFCAVEVVGGFRVDVRTRDGLHGSCETRSRRIKLAAIEIHEGRLKRGATAAEVAAHLDALGEQAEKLAKRKGGRR
jgi:hypothetical protein